jgi:hypothetical protein
MKRYTLGAFLCGAALALTAWQSARAQQEPRGAAAKLGTPGAGQAETQRREVRAPGTPEIDPRARAVLRQMSDYLASLRSFAVSADSVTEIVSNDGHKLQVLASSTVYVERPNRLRSQRRGPAADLTFYYDGNTVTLYDRSRNLYATTAAPHDIDDMIDFARAQLGIEAPGADLLYSDVYEDLMEGVRGATYIGESEVDGHPCHHLAFQEDDVDWQLWVDAGDQPLPRRYVIVTKDVPSQPEFAVDLRDWDASPTFPPGFFEFRRSPGAQRIEFLGASRAMRRG